MRLSSGLFFLNRYLPLVDTFLSLNRKYTYVFVLGRRSVAKMVYDVLFTSRVFTKHSGRLPHLLHCRYLFVLLGSTRGGLLKIIKGLLYLESLYLKVIHSCCYCMSSTNALTSSLAILLLRTYAIWERTLLIKLSLCFLAMVSLNVLLGDDPKQPNNSWFS